MQGKPLGKAIDSGGSVKRTNGRCRVGGWGAGTVAARSGKHGGEKRGGERREAREGKRGGRKRGVAGSAAARGGMAGG